MSIDVKELAKRSVIRSEKMHGVMSTDDLLSLHEEIWRESEQLIRAVIADELPSITKAVLNHPLDKLGDLIVGDTFAEALAPQPVSADGVPEFGLAMQQHKGVIRNALAKLLDQNDEWHRAKACDALDAICQQVSELSRRVAEAVAAKDKRIAELEKNLAYLLDRIPGAVRVCESGGPEDVNKSIAVSVVKLMEQLAAAQAEVERLKDMSNFEERANAWSLVWKTCNEVGMDSFKCDEYSGQGMVVAFIKHLASEVSRLTRPVAGNPEWMRAAMFADDVPVVSHETLKIERNARESAERERDELREFVREKCFWRRDDGFTSHVETMNRHWPVTDADIDKGLAAFRAEKGKVATDGHAPTNS